MVGLLPHYYSQRKPAFAPALTVSALNEDAAGDEGVEAGPEDVQVVDLHQLGQGVQVAFFRGARRGLSFLHGQA